MQQAHGVAGLGFVRSPGVSSDSGTSQSVPAYSGVRYAAFRHDGHARRAIDCLEQIGAPVRVLEEHDRVNPDETFIYTVVDDRPLGSRKLFTCRHMRKVRLASLRAKSPAEAAMKEAREQDRGFIVPKAAALAQNVIALRQPIPNLGSKVLEFRDAGFVMALHSLHLELAGKNERPRPAVVNTAWRVVQNRKRRASRDCFS